MTKSPGNPTPPRPARPPLDLSAVIRRGQRRDKIFSYLGAGLVVASLGVLVVLLGKLLYDGLPMLTHTQEVIASSGQAPRIVPVPDVVGIVKQVPGPDGKPAWQIVPDPIAVSSVRLWQSREKAPTPEEIKTFLAGAVDKRVVLESALITDPAGGQIEPEDMKLIAAGDEAYAPTAKISRKHYVGTLRQGTGLRALHGSGYEFVADPMFVDQAKMAKPTDLAADQRYAVSPARDLRKTIGTLVATDVEQMKSRSFFMSMPASAWYRAGIHSGWVGSLLLMLVTILAALPLGVAAGLYLEEYAPKNWFTGLIEINIANLAGVPSIVWGLLGLGLFVYGLGPDGVEISVQAPYIPKRYLRPIVSWLLAKLDFDKDGDVTLIAGGRTIAAAGLTLALLVLPIIIIATREAIRAIPSAIRDASIALGATKWQTTWHHILP